MSLCTQSGRGVTVISPSPTAVVPGPDINKPPAVCAGAAPPSLQPATVAAQTATGQQPKVPLHVGSQMTVNQARNAVRTGTFTENDFTPGVNQK